MAVQNEGRDWRQASRPNASMSADRAEYAAMTQSARQRYMDQQREWQDLFEQRMFGQTQDPKIVRRDISDYVDTFASSRPAEDSGNPYASPAMRGEDATSRKSFVMPPLPPGESDFEMPAQADFGPGGSIPRIDWEAIPDPPPRDVTREAEIEGQRFDTSVAAWVGRIRKADRRAKQAILAEDAGNPMLEEGVPLPDSTRPGRWTDANPVRQTAGYKTSPTPLGKDIAKAAGKDHIFMGWENRTVGGGGMSARPITMHRDAAKYWDNLVPEYQDKVLELTMRYYTGMKPTFSWIEKRWNEAINIAHNAFQQYGVYKTPFEAYSETIIKKFAEAQESRRTGGGGGGGGFGGGGGGGTISLTSPSDALYLLNQAMTQYMGREATEDELRDFVSSLNAQERANPNTVSYEGSNAVQSGGFNPALFAQQFARSQEGSAEFVATTTFMDAFLSMLGGRIGE